MSTQSLPAVSLRTGSRLPDAQVLIRGVNYLISMALWLIGAAICGLESSFLPALREAPGDNRRSPRQARGPGRSVDAEQLCRGAAEDGDLVVVAEARGREDVID